MEKTNPSLGIKKTIVIADDHPIFSEGLKQLICADQRLSVIDEVVDGHKLLASIRRQQPDLILLDVQMPVMDGLSAAKITRQDFPSVKILMLTQHDEPEYVIKLIQMGVDGYILKKNTPELLLTAIETVLFHENKKYFPDEVWEIFKRNYFEKETELIPYFTERELSIMQMICDGDKTDEIAPKVFLSIPAIEKIRSDLFSKTGSKNATQLVAYALRKGLCK
jgi:DNA-binding NarL/FixJ family response regulator